MRKICEKIGKPQKMGKTQENGVKMRKTGKNLGKIQEKPVNTGRTGFGVKAGSFGAIPADFSPFPAPS